MFCHNSSKLWRKTWQNNLTVRGTPSLYGAVTPCRLPLTRLARYIIAPHLFYFCRVLHLSVEGDPAAYRQSHSPLSYDNTNVHPKSSITPLLTRHWRVSDGPPIILLCQLGARRQGNGYLPACFEHSTFRCTVNNLKPKLLDMDGYSTYHKTSSIEGDACSRGERLPTLDTSIPTCHSSQFYRRQYALSPPPGAVSSLWGSTAWPIGATAIPTPTAYIPWQAPRPYVPDRVVTW